MKEKILKKAPIRITLFYILFSILWILFSDRLLDILFPNPDIALKVQTYKGCFFVIITGLILYKLLSREYKAHLLLEEILERDVVKEQADLLDWATDAIIVKDLEDRILFWNKGAERLYGWKKEEVLGKKVTEFHFKDISLHEKIKEKVLREGEWMGEVEQKNKDGKDIIVGNRWVLVRDKEGKPTKIMVINTDITKRKLLENQLIRAQKLESIGILAGSIAHDLKISYHLYLWGFKFLKQRLVMKVFWILLI
ncbi:MAG: hypothetical protein CBR30_06055 [Dictyoglomus sp. NZ13-RE01]|nr:MAG: hypothetical protein CBR30_06055 [Dictyoglomus sp. NZ13-RE01]